MLLEKGADPNLSNHEGPIDLQDSMLYVLSMLEHNDNDANNLDIIEKCVKLLIKYKVNINMRKPNDNHECYIHKIGFILSYSKFDTTDTAFKILQLFLENGANPNFVFNGYHFCYYLRNFGGGEMKDQKFREILQPYIRQPSLEQRCFIIAHIAHTDHSHSGTGIIAHTNLSHSGAADIIDRTDRSHAGATDIITHTDHSHSGTGIIAKMHNTQIPDYISENMMKDEIVKLAVDMINKNNTKKYEKIEELKEIMIEKMTNIVDSAYFVDDVDDIVTDIESYNELKQLFEERRVLNAKIKFLKNKMLDDYRARDNIVSEVEINKLKSAMNDKMNKKMKFLGF